ncbi:MAG: hypothetical protein QNJ51_16850 [Calothrix sp. MO_167.B12]|nr:hypothetical protein [Calothrix sp. MO_167.B12]
MKSKLTEKRVYKKPSLNIHGNVKQLTQGTASVPPVGSDICSLDSLSLSDWLDQCGR